MRPPQEECFEVFVCRKVDEARLRGEPLTELDQQVQLAIKRAEIARLIADQESEY